MRRRHFSGMLLAGAAGLWAQGNDDIAAHPRCEHCGMSRQRFSFSRMLIQYEDGTESGVCSVQCAATDLAENKEKKVKAILVADHDSGKLIDARTAHWVMGGSQPGVMTAVAKWAFEKDEDAQAFMKAKGGSASDYDAVLKAVGEEAKSGRRGHMSGMQSGSGQGMGQGTGQGMGQGGGCNCGRCKRHRGGMMQGKEAPKDAQK